MPLMRIDILEGHTEDYVQGVLDGVHRAMVDAFQVPERDRYQILTEHEPGRLVVEDTGLDLSRTDKVTLVGVTSRPRSAAAKTHFYERLCMELKARCEIEASDVMVSIVCNSDEDWSFGLGRAQFLTGEL